MNHPQKRGKKKEQARIIFKKSAENLCVNPDSMTSPTKGEEFLAQAI